MKTPTIHFMDWAVVRTDNTGLINETGLLSLWKRGGEGGSGGKGGDTKVQLVQLATELVSWWWGGEESLPKGEKEPEVDIKSKS